MAASIQNPVKCEVRSVLRFLHTKGECPADIHRQIVSVCGNIMNRQNVTKWCRAFSEGYHKLCAVCLLQDNTRPYIAHKTEALLKRFKLEVLDHPPYSPDLAPSEFHLFLYLKRHLAGQYFHDVDEIKNKVEMWFREQAVVS
ncbi:hypothetical protein AVEN_64284-1 [Araneus ventricosus]|uniref:Mos1 transposase HTH domain-containing protein n=1 Tax=Araneus ventricosus TaxID=182803 RepID=A0A4Y2MVZ8_ARAVE|nr:hypothetical protein AVEN_64284-1 [Araneus ventricosus]